MQGKIRHIRGQDVTTQRKEIKSYGKMIVEAGTTGYRGWDAGDGGKTFISIVGTENTDIRIKPRKNILGEDSGVDVELNGDTELSMTIDALKFITDVLEEQSGQNKAGKDASSA